LGRGIGMSADGSVELEWGDGEHKFRLAIGQLRELQEKVNRPRVAIGAHPIGLQQLLSGFRDGSWWIDDVSEIIRLGLIGGGKAPIDALSLTQRYCLSRPPLESVPIAQVILLTALIGDPDDVVGSKKNEETTTMPESSSSPSTTEPAQH
jgi:hypothetical protein